MTEEEKFFPQEMYMRSQLERQRGPLQYQKENYSELLKKESHLINRTVCADAFTNDSVLFDNWEIGTFHPGSIEGPTEMRSDWSPLELNPPGQGLQLRSNIIRCAKKISLSAIACEYKLSFRLIADSTLWIISRARDVKDSNAVICKIKKEQDNQRVFLIFGANIGRNHEFKFFKKQEFPEISRNGEEVLNDYVELKLKFVENGDDRVFVKATLGKDRVVEMSCDKYIPCFEETQVMIAGSGDSVVVKNVSVRQIARLAGKPNMNRYECCNIF